MVLIKYDITQANSPKPNTYQIFIDGILILTAFEQNFATITKDTILGSHFVDMVKITGFTDGEVRLRIYEVDSSNNQIGSDLFNLFTSQTNTIGISGFFTVIDSSPPPIDPTGITLRATGIPSDEKVNIALKLNGVFLFSGIDNLKDIVINPFVANIQLLDGINIFELSSSFVPQQIHLEVFTSDKVLLDTILTTKVSTGVGIAILDTTSTITAPDAPTNLTATQQQQQPLIWRLEWQPPLNVGSSPLTNYLLTLLRNGVPFLTDQQLVSNVLSFDVTVIEGDTYEAFIKAKSLDGTSLSSNTVTFITEPVTPPPSGNIDVTLNIPSVSLDGTQFLSQMDVIPNADAIGENVTYLLVLRDGVTNLEIRQKERNVLLSGGDIDGRSMNESTIQVHDSVKVTWSVVHPTLGILAITNQLITNTSLAPIEKPNESFTVTFFDGSVESFILSDADFILLNDKYSGNPNLGISIGTDTDLQEQTFTAVDQFIIDKLATAPQLAPDSFLQQFTALEYKATPLGKSLFAQIQITKLKEISEDTITIALQVRREDGSEIGQIFKTESILGVNAFPVVFDIPDLVDIAGIDPTATIFVDSFIIATSSINNTFKFLADTISVKRTIDTPEPIPDTSNRNTIDKQIVGTIFSMAALSILGSKG